MIVDPQHFALMWSRQARDVIAFHRGYVRITGDVGAALALSQILYWFDADETGKARVRVVRDGELWLAKSAEGLAAELGIVDEDGRPRAKIARRYIHTLLSLGLIRVDVWRFDGAPTTHIQPVWEVIADRIARFAQMGISESVNSETGSSICPNGHPDLPTVGKSRTENTTKTTTETTGEAEGSEVVVLAEPAPAIVPATAPGTAAPELDDDPDVEPGPKPSARRSRPAPKPIPEKKPGTFQIVFREICRVRRTSADVLNEEDRYNTRGLTSILCRNGVEDAATVEAWGVEWYANMAARRRCKKSQVSPPSISQLKSWFGGCIARRDGDVLEISDEPTGGKRWLTN